VSRDRRDLSGEDARPRQGESFLQRFHRRKTEARHTAEQAVVPAVETGDVSAESGGPGPEPEPTDADMPPLESLTAESDYRGFLSAKVSETLRRAALRKLFHGSQFNVIDELDDYAEDFTNFKSLGDFVTADMRHRIEVEARRQAEAFQQALLDDEPLDAQTEPLAVLDQQTPDAHADSQDNADEAAGRATSEAPDGLPAASPSES
jgi:hypothetical protein